MKAILFSFVLLISCTFAKAQLANTRWSGSIMAPSIVDVNLVFTKDTLKITVAGQSDVLETMTYTVKDSVITIKKVFGGSPCNDGSSATMKYIIKGNNLFLSVLNDPCEARKNAWPPEPFVKLKD